ncbi:hypothetical protein SLUN_21830 [Streptomyces lunaelactis]|uniref:Uncharacterized protein n=1 Tax=Streptomyces lunaelactis TaxID=1535768 RepID=A0A2R4T5I7_9ACTN|nr:hypothetical protein SLUN_21830 [Streptomyces lunaelactis]
MQTFDASSVVFSRASASSPGLGSAGVLGVFWGHLGAWQAWDRVRPMWLGCDRTRVGQRAERALMM